MATWWRIQELGGRFYPEYTQDNGETWRRDYHVAVRNGYAVEYAARKWAETSIENGAAGWWKTPEALTTEEREALNKWLASHDTSDDTESEQERRLRFIRWLIEHGKLGAGDQSSDDSSTVVQSELLRSE